jgi:flagellar motor switch protein FliG
MAKFQGGLDEMIKALQLMMPGERKRLIDGLAEKDPEMAQLIQSKLYSLENLKDISPKMLVEYLREVNLSELALALKLYSEELQQYLMSKVSKSMAQDILEVLEGPKRRQSECEEAESKVLGIFRKMIDEERIIISKDDKMV